MLLSDLVAQLTNLAADLPADATVFALAPDADSSTLSPACASLEIEAAETLRAPHEATIAVVLLLAPPM